MLDSFATENSYKSQHYRLQTKNYASVVRIFTLIHTQKVSSTAEKWKIIVPRYWYFLKITRRYRY